MRFEEFFFGSIRIDGFSYDHDVVIDRGEVRKRKKKASKKFREAFGTHRCHWKKAYHGSDDVAW